MKKTMVRRSLLLSFAIGSLGAHAFGGSKTPLKAWVAKKRSSVTTCRLSSASDSEDNSGKQHVSIEYCTGCRWMLRSAWLAQELLTTFQEELDSVTLIPSQPPAPGGIFRVERNGELVWDRKEEGGFPESKELKQRVRDLIAPSHFLGHSDSAERQQESSIPGSREDCEDCPDADVNLSESTRKIDSAISTQAASPNIAITYCTGCRWLLRAAWFAQELLTTFDTELSSVTLIPSRPPEPGGMFLVKLNDALIWDRSEMGGFPELKKVKQRIRDEIAPSHNLGHSDTSETQEEPLFEDMDDDDAAEMRTFYGVM